MSLVTSEVLPSGHLTIMSTIVHFVALYAVMVVQVFCAYGLIKYVKLKVSTETRAKVDNMYISRKIQKSHITFFFHSP